MNTNEFTQIVRPTVLANKNFNKIFCIGQNKTGTTTLEGVLQLYGYTMPNQQEQEIRLTKSCFEGDYRELQSFVNQFDAFQDLPFAQGEIYAVADALFPGSKFILTERDSESWFESLTAFHRRNLGVDDLNQLGENDILNRFNYLYPNYSHENKKWFLTTFDGNSATTRWDLLYNKDFYIREYLNRNQRIKRFFQNCQNKFLTIDVSRENTTEKLCKFLNIPVELAIDMPHLNKTS